MGPNEFSGKRPIQNGYSGCTFFPRKLKFQSNCTNFEPNAIGSCGCICFTTTATAPIWSYLQSFQFRDNSMYFEPAVPSICIWMNAAICFITCTVFSESTSILDWIAPVLSQLQLFQAACDDFELLWKLERQLWKVMVQKITDDKWRNWQVTSAGGRYEKKNSSQKLSPASVMPFIIIGIRIDRSTSTHEQDKKKSRLNNMLYSTELFCSSQLIAMYTVCALKSYH